MPAWGLLSKNNWKEQLDSYIIKESPTLYSDYSALRLMLEIEKKCKESLYVSSKKYWDDEVCFWRELPNDVFTPNTGFRDGKPINKVVHDPNAFLITSFCSHAGLFATIKGICKTILNFEIKLNLCKFILNEFENKKDNERFIGGWDRVTDLQQTLAGKGCSEKTFGHLGFTGTSIWIDPVSKKGVVVLSNATKNHWHEKDGLNEIRRKIGSFVFQEL